MVRLDHGHIPGRRRVRRLAVRLARRPHRPRAGHGFQRPYLRRLHRAARPGLAPRHLAALRFLSALGMGGEWALGVALVME